MIQTDWLVGYSKIDINPWLDPKDHSKGLLLPDKDDDGNYIIAPNGHYQDGIPLAGYGNTPGRPVLNRLDDNGDGKIDDNDGLFATCTCVTDTNGTTMFFVTLDAVGPAGDSVTDLRKSIVAALEKAGYTVSPEQIMISGTHTHTGPDFILLSIAEEETNPKRKQYYDYILSQVAQAVVQAYSSRKAAVMTKTTLAVSDAINAKYHCDIRMNCIRHFAMEASLQYVDGETVLQENKDPQIVCGANMGIYHSHKYMQTHNPWYHTLATDGQREYRMCVTGQTPVAAADDTMDLLLFTVADDTPIVLVNWQAHPDNIGSNYVSSDYIGSLRYRLENNKTLFGGKFDYRVSFFQGASGNLSPYNAVGPATWQNLTVAELQNDYATAPNRNPFNKYGYLLAGAALSALEDGNAVWSDPLTGDIRHKQLIFAAPRQVYSEGLCAAAAAWKAAVNAGETPTFPYAHKHTDGRYYVLSSKFHTNWVLAQTTTNPEPVNLELNAIFLGEKLAIVTAPDELFDRYNSTGEYRDGSRNEWDKLLGDAYGMPMIFGYTNGHMGYIANIGTYRYNENAIVNGKYMLCIGSYEAGNSKFQEGTGEKLVDAFAQMLKEAAAGPYDTCQ